MLFDRIYFSMDIRVSPATIQKMEIDKLAAMRCEKWGKDSESKEINKYESK